MTKETLEAASTLIRSLLGELGLPADATEALQRIADRMLDELGRSGVSPGGPTLAEELTAQSQRATLNIVGIAQLVMRSGVPPEPVRDLIRAHMLRQITSEQILVHALLDLSRRDEAETLH